MRPLLCVTGAAAVLAIASHSSGQCANSCPFPGDFSEGEPCLQDLGVDTTNAGCDSGPPAFTVANPGATSCGVISTYNNQFNAAVRDTDWYLITQGQLAAADGDGDGIVHVRARLFSDFPGTVLIMALGSPVCSNPAVVGIGGWSGPWCMASVTGRDAEHGAQVAAHPGGLAVQVSIGNHNGSPIISGYACSSLQNDYQLTIELSDAPGAVIATGPAEAADGYLRVAPDAYGSWVAPAAGGRGDLFNPAGPAGAEPVAYTSGTFLFVPGEGARELLTEYPGWDGVAVGSFHLDETLERAVLAGPVASDTDGDLVDDTLTSTFRVFGGTVNLRVNLTQRVHAVASGVSALTQTWEVINDAAVPLDAVFVRVLDADLDWSGNYANDSVGTNTNAALTPERRVFIREADDTATQVTLASVLGDAYFGGKHGALPAGGPPAYGFGTDTEVWSAGGVPLTWRNHVAGVGTDVDGESGPSAPGCTPPCDGFIGLELPVGVLAPDESAFVQVQAIFGFGDFSIPQEFQAAGEATRDATGDFDGDGVDDAIVLVPPAGAGPHQPGRAQVFLNQGNAGPLWLGLAPNQPVNVGVEPSAVAVGQLNIQFDGALDAVASNQGDNTVSVLINANLGDGTFLPAQPYSAGASPSSVTVGDFNEDGFADLVVANEQDDNLTLLAGDGFGGFVPLLASPPIMIGGSRPVALVTDDLDNDKCDDIAGTSRFNAPVAATGGEGPPVPGVVFILKSNGDGTFQPPVVFDIGIEPRDIATGDFDEDGTTDLVATNSGDATVSYLTNQGVMGTPTFDPPVNLAVGGTPVSVKAVDFDNDGDSDLAVVADDADIGGEQAVQFVKNTTSGGSPTFGAPLGYSVNASPNFVAAADFDVNGLVDLVTANTDDGITGGSVTVLLNEQDVPVSLCPGDTNGDQSVDIADLLSLLSLWGLCGPPCPPDFDEDGMVGIFDLLTLLGAWGVCP